LEREQEKLPCVVRRAVRSDSEGILTCLREAFAPYRGSYTAAAYEDTVLNPETLSDRLQAMVVLVASDRNGRVLGTIGGAVLGREGHVRGMAVLPEVQGSGIAARLLAAVEDELRVRGCSKISLDTTAPLARAIRFYERSGYRRSGKVADFFGMPLSEYVKDL
jgi:ribosomal protein S18 acetylase RimI-like enzyme